VANRRQVRFGSLEDLLAGAAALVAADADGRVTVLGNLSLGQALEHLARWFDASIDAVPVKPPPAALRLTARALRGYFFNRGLPTGAKLQPDAEALFIPPADTSAPAALDHLRRSVERLRSTSQRAVSPLFGPLSAAEWERLHLRHAELHLSFMQIAPA
jgi:hypothetical protein